MRANRRRGARGRLTMMGSASVADKFECWKCGESLKGVARPITRFSRCPVCRSDLHVCKLCRHYDPKVLGECRHDRAERVVDKEQANFCTHFRPRRDAHTGREDQANQSARAALDALFGLGDADKPQDAGDPRAAANRAREELNELFDLGEDSDRRDDA